MIQDKNALGERLRGVDGFPGQPSAGGDLGNFPEVDTRQNLQELPELPAAGMPQNFPGGESSPVADLEWPGLPPSIREAYPHDDFPAASEAAGPVEEMAGMEQYRREDGSVVTEFAEHEGRGEAESQWPLPVSLGDKEEKDNSIGAMLQKIADGLEKLTAGAGDKQPGHQAYQFPWSEAGFSSLEDVEDYPAGSPAVNVTNMNGARGAGGYGFGSKFGHLTGVDKFEPSRRSSGVG